MEMRVLLTLKARENQIDGETQKNEKQNKHHLQETPIIKVK